MQHSESIFLEEIYNDIADGEYYKASKRLEARLKVLNLISENKHALSLNRLIWLFRTRRKIQALIERLYS